MHPSCDIHDFGTRSQTWTVVISAMRSSMPLVKKGLSVLHFTWRCLINLQSLVHVEWVKKRLTGFIIFYCQHEPV